MVSEKSLGLRGRLARSAVRLMAGEQFRLYIVDGQLPGVSGLTLCQQIRQVGTLNRERYKGHDDWKLSAPVRPTGPDRPTA
jgi:CheY-like chemotaxis protein